MVNQEKLLKEIKSLSDSIRHKNRALKLGISEKEKFLESTFKPITEPLKQLGRNIEKHSFTFPGDAILPISKYEPKEEYEGDTSFTTQQGETTEDESGEETDVLSEKEGLSTSGEQEEEEFITNPSNLSKLGSDIRYKGPLARQFVLKMLHSAQPNRKYHTFGARMAENGLMIGDSKLDVDEHDNITINNKQYKGTKGLFELIFKPKPNVYTQKDLSIFKQILEDTNAHRKDYSKIPMFIEIHRKNIKPLLPTFFHQKEEIQLKGNHYLLRKLIFYIKEEEQINRVHRERDY